MEARINYNKDFEMWRVKFERCTVLYEEVDIKCPCKTVIENGNAYLLVNYSISTSLSGSKLLLQ